MELSFRVTVKKTEPVTVAFTSMKGPYSQIPEAFDRLYKWAGEKGYVPSGPPSTLYFNIRGQVPDDQLLWEIRSPIAGMIEPKQPDEGIGVKQVEATQVAATLHRGRYERIGDTYDTLIRWILENGYEINGPAEELYLNDLATTPPDQLLTEVRLPARKG